MPPAQSPAAPPSRRDLQSAVRKSPATRNILAAGREIKDSLRGLVESVAAPDSESGGGRGRGRDVRTLFRNSNNAAAPAARRSLRMLSAQNPSLYWRVLRHPTLQGNVPDDWAKVVAMLHSVARANPRLVERLLDPKVVRAEQRTIELPRSGRVDLAIVRLKPGARHSMDLLERSVRGAERLMAAPLPTGYVGLLYADVLSGSTLGVNYGTHITLGPEYDVDDGSREAYQNAQIMAHEVGHYYWNKNASWLDEGASDLLGYVVAASEGDRGGNDRRAATVIYPTGHFRSIAELERRRPAPNSPAFIAHYALGQRVFLGLHRALGDAAFLRGMRELYRRSGGAGVQELRAAFAAANPTPAAVRAVDAVIARWHRGVGSHDLSGLDRSRPDPALPDIDGSVKRVWIALSPHGRAVTEFASSRAPDHAWLGLDYAQRMFRRRQSAQVQLEIAEFYEDGFQTRRGRLNIRATAFSDGGRQFYSIGPHVRGQAWAPGRHWVYVYDGKRKVAEASFNVLTG